MKSSWIIGTTLTVISIFLITAYTSCDKPAESTYIDKCANVTCQNNGTCVDGACSCPLGFEGDQCEENTNRYYLGKWEVTQTIASSTDQSTIGQSKTYTVEIKEKTPTQLTIDNLLGESYIKGVKLVIHQKIGAEVIDSVTVETEVIASANNFVFEKNQALSGSTKQIVKGEGELSANATTISGYIYLVSPHPTLNVLNERIDFSAQYVK